MSGSTPRRAMTGAWRLQPSGLRACAMLVLLALSAFLQFTTVTQTRQDGVIHGDATKYVFYAYNLKHHRVFSRTQSFGPGHDQAAPAPDKLTLPGYPAFLSLFLGAGAPDAAFVRRATLAQAGLGVASTLLAFLIALRLLPLGWAFAAGLLTATLPHFATFSAHLMTEPLFTSLLLASVLAMLSAARPAAGLSRMMLAGVLLGLACLVRPQLQLLPALAILAALLSSRLRPQLPRVLLATACFAAVLGPWYARNAGLERPPGEPDLLVTTLYHGSFPGFMYRDDPRTFGYPYRADPDQARITADLDSVLSHIGASFRAEPARTARWYLLGKPGFFLSWGIVAGVGDIFVYPVAASPWLQRPLFAGIRDIAFVLHWPLMLLALAAMLLATWRPRLLSQEPARRHAAILLSVLLLYVIAMHMLGTPLPRYNVPFRPLEFTLALVALHAAWTRWRGRGLAAEPR
jgi:4-amino-4-deoxy-L-arabinose transferase-like glycosyltransferase